MVTQEGNNVQVCAVVGNFDDAQSGVKRIFSDESIREELDGRGYFLSSANSINFGRILPQVVYYVSAYCDLLQQGSVAVGEMVNFCVPTGNFGNILACYYAKKMGIPVGKLICASNSNDVLTEFLRSGVYNRNRPFHTTMSPSMDILISSNLERLLFDLSGEDDVLVRRYMEQLRTDGCYQVSEDIYAQLAELFYGGCCNEEETAQTMRDSFANGYLIDPHTAVAAKVLADYRRESGDDRKAVFVSTASPYKFCDSVLTALGETPAKDSLERISQLERISGTTAPCCLSGLQGKQARFAQVTEKSQMEQVVLDFLA